MFPQWTFVSEMLTAFSDPDDVVYEPFLRQRHPTHQRAVRNGRTCPLAMEMDRRNIATWAVSALATVHRPELSPRSASAAQASRSQPSTASG